MNQVSTLTQRADDIENASYASASITGLSVAYAGLSIPGHVADGSPITNDGKLSMVVNGIADINQVVSVFLENTLSIQAPANVVGLVMGLGVAAIAGFCCRRQLKKIKKFRQQADELKGKNLGFSHLSNELKV